jgi:hypothetical protein
MKQGISEKIEHFLNYSKVSTFENNIVNYVYEKYLYDI